MITINDLKQIALITDIPIMSDETIEAISKEIVLHHCFTLLEIGTAIGYSSLYLAHLHPHLTIVTLEKDEDRYLEALKYKKQLDDRNQVTMICQDAFEFIPHLMVDCIILDGAKAANLRLFQRFFPFLKSSGVMIVDNMDFHGARSQDISLRSRQFKKMIHKLSTFEAWIMNQKHLNVMKIHVGDGLLKITHKHNDESFYGKIEQ